MSLKDIVNVSITRETKAVSQMGFGTLLITGLHKAFPERSRLYSDLEALSLDFDSTSEVYIAAQSLLSQSPVVTKFRVGHKQANNLTVLVTTAIALKTYRIDITTAAGAGTAQFTADASPTVAEIEAGLISAVNALTASLGVSATGTGAGNLTITQATNLAFSFKFVDNKETLGVKLTASALSGSDETWVEALVAIQDVVDDWYGVACLTHTKAEVETIAAWCETKTKIYGTSSRDTTVLVAPDSDTTSIAHSLFASAYDRTFLLYSEEADTKWPECGMFGKFLPTTPGEMTVCFKDIKGLTPSELTPDKENNALLKNVNTFRLVGGARIIRQGDVVSGEYIDTMVFVDWLQARITERVYSRLVNMAKVPFTDAGISVIEAEIKAVLEQGITNGGLTNDPEPVVTVPLAADVPFTDKASRTLGSAEAPVRFVATLAGAIHAVTINGTVTL